MALAIVFPFDVKDREGSYSTPVLSYLEGASQTYKKGAPLINGATTEVGYLIEAAIANPATYTGLVGVALANAENLAHGAADPTTGDSYHLAYPPNDDLIFIGQLDASATTLAAGTHALAQTDLWAQYGITHDATSGFWYVNFSDTTDVRVVVVELIDPLGTIAGRVAFKWLKTATFTVYA